ncbi:MAG TPA: immunoglobulin domain-containing protein [Verrucomicrobiae bacterium]
MKTITLTVLLTALIRFGSDSVFGASIGANFLGDGAGETALSAADSAGVVAQLNWNNINSVATGNVGISEPLMDASGNVTGVLLQFEANDAWNADGPTATPDEKLMKGVIKQGTIGTSMTLTFTNLAAATYDVYVYGDVNGGPVDLDVSIGSTTNYWTEPAYFDAAAGFMAAASSDPFARAGGNYAKFSGVTPVDGAITVHATYLAGSDGLGIAALQLVTAGSFPTNTTPVAITVQPQPQLAAPGGTATFSVVASGPGAGYQWLKEGAPISGATRSSYSTAPLALSDDGAKYKVTVRNNVNSVTSDEVRLTVMNDPGTRVASIGANFLGSAGTPTDVLQWQLAPADLAGVVPRGNWNNVNFGDGDWGNFGGVKVGVSGSLLDSAGQLSSAQIQVQCNDAWNADGAADTPNGKLMKGILKQAGVGSAMTLVVSNLTVGPAFFDVYVYGNVNGGPVDLDVSIGDKTFYWTEPAAFDEATGFAEAASTDPNARASGNYVKFAGVGVASGSGTITIKATYQGGSDGLGIAGLQVFSSAAFPRNTSPVGIGAQPRPTVAAPGNSATFLVWATGPSPRFQWLKDSSPIAGATSSSYTTPPVALSDSGAKYQVIVSNEVSSVASDLVVLSVTNDPGTRVASIGANFLGSTGTPTDVLQWQLAPADSAGVVAQTNWNNINFGGGDWGNFGGLHVGLSGGLADSAGELTAIQVEVHCNDAWNADGPADTPNARLMKGVYKQSGGSMTILFTNLAPAFYDVYVYGDVDTGPEDLDVSIGATTYYWTEPGAYDPATGFILSASTDPNARAAGNYVRFTGVTPASSTITVTATVVSGPTGLGIAGVQLVPSGAFPAIATLNPRLSAAAGSGHIAISWDSPASYRLQSSPSLTSQSWSDETTPALVIGTQHTVQLAATGAARFFRLAGP